MTDPKILTTDEAREALPMTDEEWNRVRMEPDPIAALSRRPAASDPVDEAREALLEAVPSDWGRARVRAFEAAIRAEAGGLDVEAARAALYPYDGLPSRRWLVFEDEDHTFGAVAADEGNQNISWPEMGEHDVAFMVAEHNVAVARLERAEAKLVESAETLRALREAVAVTLTEPFDLDPLRKAYQETIGTTGHLSLAATPAEDDAKDAER